MNYRAVTTAALDRSSFAERDPRALNPSEVHLVCKFEGTEEECKVYLEQGGGGWMYDTKLYRATPVKKPPKTQPPK